MARPLSPVNEHLAGCTPADRAALQHVRELVHDELPGLLEVRSYRLPAFALPRFTGPGGSAKDVVGGFSAGARFLSWYPFSGRTLATLADELAGFQTTKGSVHFTARRMLGDELVRQLVRTRLAEIQHG